jgi:hypothetical protein
MSNIRYEEQNLTRYLIIGRARSGTTVTHLVLLGHPNVAALNDELKPEPFFTRAISSFTFGNDLPEERALGLSRLFDAVTSIRATADTLALGAKTVCNSPELAARLVETLRERMPELKIVHFVRQDLVALYGSARQGRRSGIMHSWYPDYQSRTVDTMRIRKWPFTTFALGCLRTNEAVCKLGDSHDYMEIVYEDYLNDPESIHQQLFEFLGLPVVAATWLKSEKVMPPASQYIRNYDLATAWAQELKEYVQSGSSRPAIERSGRLGRIWKRFDRLLG